MTVLSIRGWLLLFVFAALTASACSKDPASPEPARGESAPLPTLPSPDVVPAVEFPATSDQAREARTFVRGQLQRVNLEFSRMAGILRSYRAIPYESIAENEWLADTTDGSRACRSYFAVTHAAASLRWQWVSTGACVGQAEAYPLSEIASSLDGRSGSLDEHWAAGVFGGRIQKYGRVEWAIEPTSAQWRLFSRETTPSTLLVSFDQQSGENGRAAHELSRTAEYRWELGASADSASGEFRLYRWNADASEWDESDDVRWTGRHGSWVSRPVDGPAVERTW